MSASPIGSLVRPGRGGVLALALCLATGACLTLAARSSLAATCAPPCAYACRDLSGWSGQKLKRALRRAEKGLQSASVSTRQAAIHAVIDVLAVNKQVKPSGQRLGDYGRAVIRLRVPLGRKTLQALATALLDPDPGVQRCASGALEQLVFTFKHPQLPQPDLSVRQTALLPLGQRLAKMPVRVQRASTLLLLAAGHHGAEGDMHTEGAWQKLAPALSKDQLAPLTRVILRILDRPGPRPDYWRGAASSALHHLLMADETKRHGEASLLVAEARNRFHRAKRPFPDHVAEGRVLKTLLRGSLAPARRKRAFAVLERRMVAPINLLETVDLLGYFQDPGRQLRAARLLDKRLRPRVSFTSKAATVLARLGSPGAQAIAAKAFRRVLGSGKPIMLQVICKAVSEMTHGPAQATLLNGVATVAHSAHSHYVRGPAILALGRMVDPQAQMKAVRILRALTQDKKVRIRSNAVHAIGLLRDSAAQATALGDVVKALKDPDGLTRVEATKSLGQFSDPAAQKRARQQLAQLRSSLSAGVPLAPQLRSITACALKQLDGRRAREARCPY